MPGFEKDLAQLAKASVAFSLSSAIGRASQVFTAPLITRVLLPSDYGILSLIQVTIALFAIMAGSNIGSATTYFFHAASSKTEKGRVIFNSSILVLMAAITLGFLLWLFSFEVAMAFVLMGLVSDYGEVAVFLRVASVTLVATLVQLFTLTVLRLHNRLMSYVSVEIGVVVLKLVSVVLLVLVFDFGVLGVLAGTLIGALFGCVLGVIYTIGYMDLAIRRSLMGLLLVYALPQLPGVLINWFQMHVGRLLIGVYSDLRELGLYAVAFVISSCVTMINSGVRLAWEPYALSFMNQDDAPRRYAQFFELIVVVFGLVYILVAFFSRPIVMLIAGPAFLEAYILIPWLVGAVYLMAVNNVLALGIWITKKTFYTSVAQSITFLVVLSLSLLVVPLFGALGAAVAFFVGAISQSLAYQVIAQRLYPVAYRFLHMLALVSCLVAIACVVASLSSNAGWWSSIRVSLLASIIGLILVVQIVPSQKNRSAVIGWFLRSLPFVSK